MPLGWSDFLVRRGPAGIRPFLSARLDLVPRRVWRDYQRAMGAQAGWTRILDKYGVRTIVADKDLQSAFVTGARTDPDWEVIYEDDASIVFSAKGPSDRRQASSAPSVGDAGPDVAARTTAEGNSNHDALATAVATTASGVFCCCKRPCWVALPAGPVPSFSHCASETNCRPCGLSR